MAHFLCHLGCSHFGALLLDFYFTENNMDALFAAIKMKTHDIGKQKGANREHGTYYL